MTSSLTSEFVELVFYGRMVRWLYIVTITAFHHGIIFMREQTENHTEFDFLSEFKIVRTKILDKRKGTIVLNLKTLDDVVLLPLILFEASDGFSRLSPRFTSFTVYNSTGVYKIPQSIEYYQGHVSSREDDSYVHGTLYKDRTFEGVIKLTSRTIYLEAVDRHKPWAHDQSVMYDKDDVGAFSEGSTNFEEMHDNSNAIQHTGLSSIKDLYRKHLAVENRVKQRRSKRRTDEEHIRYCSVHAVVDGYFTHYMANDDKRESAKLIAQFIRNVHEIFRSQDFDSNKQPDNVGLVLSALTFIDKVVGFNYLRTNKSSRDFLMQFSANYRFPGVCATVGFTFQNFWDTLGIAWVAETYSYKPPSTGIGSSKSHSIITTLLHGRRVTSRVAQLTLAHELGHTFGSTHDPVSSGAHECSPSDEKGGKYIMFSTTSEGRLPNNFEFSSCSKKKIRLILRARPRVLRNYESPYCGNSLIEKGEECDCGTPLSCKSLDQCCTPSGHKNQCLLRRDHGAICSPAVHSCCTDSCKIMGLNEAELCGGFEECEVLTYCDGEHFACPVATAKPNGTLCKSGTHLCEAGDCLKSVCEVAGLSNCLCASITDACKLCCTNHSNPEPSCKPANGYLWFTENNYDIAVWLQAGSLCLEQTGYCSADNLCMKPGIDYISLAGKQLNEWFDNHWYAVMMLIFVLMGIFLIFWCSKDSRRSKTSAAFRVGHISRVIYECRCQHKMLNEQIVRLNHSSRLFECGQLDLAAGLTRLMLLFPLTTSHFLYRVMVNSANEAGAVKKLILMRQPMIADCTTYKALKSEMKESMTVGKANEQFYGYLVATVNDITQLTDVTRASLGITTPSAPEVDKMMKNRRRRLTKSVAHIFNSL